MMNLPKPFSDITRPECFSSTNSDVTIARLHINKLYIVERDLNADVVEVVHVPIDDKGSENEKTTKTHPFDVYYPLKVFPSTDPSMVYVYVYSKHSATRNTVFLIRLFYSSVEECKERILTANPGKQRLLYGPRPD